MRTNRRFIPLHPAEPRRGLVLVLVLIILVVLAALTTALSLRVTQTRRRQEYMMDYQRARYACDSALKYVLNILPDQKFNVVAREGMPDFSDLFWMDQADYEIYIRAWLETATEEQVSKVLEASGAEEEEELSEMTLIQALTLLAEKIAHPNDLAYEEPEESFRQVDPNQIRVPGPYGVSWPYVMEPIELEMGPARVSITVEDENAKMPLGWAVSKNKVAQAALKTFCEWMSMDEAEIEDLQKQCEVIQEQKTFVIDPQPILIKSRTATAAQRAAPATSRFRTTRQTTARTLTRTTAPVADVLRPAIAHATDFGKLFHSSLLNVEDLAYPRRDAGKRNESPLRYLALWGSQEVNINTAPRQVLEAAFTFSGQPEKIADLIIENRMTKPFRSARELEDLLAEDRQRLQAAAPYITTQSSFFQIQVSSRCGNARCAAVATVFKDQKKVQTLAVLYGR